MASRTIGTKLVIEGEAQYKQAIKNCNDTIKMLKSELAATTSEFRNNASSMEAVKAKGEVLTKMYDAQKQKVDAIRTALDSAKTTQNNYQQKIEQCKEKIAELDLQLSRAQASTEDLSFEEADLTKQLEEQRRALAEAEAGNKAASTAVNKHTQELNYAQVQLDKFDDELSENAKQLDKVENQAEDTSVSVEKLGDNMKESAGSACKLGNEAADAINAFAKVMVGSKVADYVKLLASALLDCSNAAADFESGMKETFTLLPGITDDAKDKMSKDMLEFSTSMNVLSEEAIPALYNSISAGVPEENVFSFLETAQKAAVGGVTDLGVAVDGLTSITNAYNDETQDATKTADQMFTAVKLGKTTFGELSQSIYNVVPTAAAANISFGNVSAAMAVMTAQGVPTSVATTKLRQMFVELTDSGSQVSKTFQAIAGKSFKQFINEGGNVQGALQLLEKHAKATGVGTDELFSSVEAGSSALLLTGGATEKFSEALNAMENSTGAVDAAYEEMADSAEYQSKRLEVSFGNLKTAIGEALLPAISDMKSEGADAFEWATEFVEENPEFVQAIAGATAAVAALSAGMLGLKTITELMNYAGVALKTFFLEVGAPIAIVGAALGVLIPIVNDFIDELGSYDRELENITENASNLSQKVDDANSKFEENKNSIEKTSGVAKIYVDRLKSLEDEMKNLESQGKDTTKQHEEYRILVEKLNKEIPDLNAQLDEQTGLLVGGTEALEDQLKAWEELQMQKAYEEKYAEIYQAQAEAQLELSENEASLNEVIAEGNFLREEQNAKYQELAELCGISAEQLQGYVDLNQIAAGIDEEHAGKVAELSGEILNLDDQLSSNLEQQALYQEAVDIGNEKLAEASGKVDEAGQAYISLQESLQGATEATTAASNAYEYMEGPIESLKARMVTLRAKYDEAYASAYNSITNQMQLFKDYELDTGISVDGIMGSLDQQVGFMRNYAENIRTLSEWGIDQGFLETLDDGSNESASILQAIVDGGQDKIKELNEKLREVESGKEDFSDTMAEMKTNFQEEATKIEQSFEAMARELNQKDAAYSSAAQTMTGAIDGLRSQYSNLKYWVEQVKSKMAEINSVSVNGSHMAGLSTVPFDGYIAELHAGERVLTATQARAYDVEKARGLTKPVEPIIPQYIHENHENSPVRSSNEGTAEGIARMVAKVVREMLSGAEVVLDDEKVGEFAVKKVEEEVFA